MLVESQIKPGVDIRILAPQWALGFPMIQHCFLSRGYSCVVTSGNDSVHRAKSFHPSGKALDFRTRHIPMIDKLPIVNSVKTALGLQWDVVFENAGHDNEHMHVEYDPKEPPRSVEA